MNLKPAGANIADYEIISQYSAADTVETQTELQSWYPTSEFVSETFQMQRSQSIRKPQYRVF